MDQKQAIADRLKAANNILVTVSNNPSVDQLASCIGLTLALNKLGKHATAVFSGNVPSTMEFLQPEKTLEKDTNSLRDFIISLDKAKADKLRYKVEDKVVKIFITPYRTSITDKDLEFSQGDFNVDVVIALGVHVQTDLDQAITAHGRILHDAVVATVNIKPGGELGTMNWLDQRASSLAELAVELTDAIDKELMDGQMATAFLTGIVAETDRFSNEKTTPATMSVSAELMAAGANQQLVATKLKAPEPTPEPQHVIDASDKPADAAAVAAKPDDGTLEITHDAIQAPAADSPEPPKTDDSNNDDQKNEDEKPEESKEAEPVPAPQIHIDDQGSLRSMEEEKVQPADEDKGSTDPTEHMGSAHMILQPPSMGGQLSSSGLPDEPEPSSSDPLSLPRPGEPTAQPATSSMPFTSPASATTAPTSGLFSPTTSQPDLTPSTAPVTPSPAPPMPTPAPQPIFTPPAPQPVSTPVPQAPPATPIPAPTPIAQSPAPTETLSEIEQHVNSPHLQPFMTAPNEPQPSPLFTPAPQPTPPAPTPFTPPPAPFTPAPPPPEPVAAPATPEPTEAETGAADLASAREAVMQAIAGQSGKTAEPIQALNAQPLGDPLHALGQPSADGTTFAPSVVQPGTPGDNMAPPPTPPPMLPPIQP